MSLLVLAYLGLSWEFGLEFFLGGALFLVHYTPCHRRKLVRLVQ
jgi:hypothetical protein